MAHSMVQQMVKGIRQYPQRCRGQEDQRQGIWRESFISAQVSVSTSPSVLYIGYKADHVQYMTRKSLAFFEKFRSCYSCFDPTQIFCASGHISSADSA